MTDLYIRPDSKVFAKSDDKTGVILGKQVGTVDRLDGGNYVKLKSYDSFDGKHHWIPLKWVVRTESNVIFLNKTQEEFRKGQLS